MDGLSAAFDVEFGEQVGGVCFDGVDGDEEFVGDFLVGEAGGEEFEDFVFAFGYAEFFESGWVEDEGGGSGDGDGFFPGEFGTGPDADGGEQDGEDSDIEFEREVAHEEAELEEFEYEDEYCEGEAVEDDDAGHGRK